MAVYNNSRQLLNMFKNISGFARMNVLEAYTATSNMKFHSLSFNNNSPVNFTKMKLISSANYNILYNNKKIPIQLARKYNANVYKVGPRPDPHTEKRNLDYQVIYPKDYVYSLKPLNVRRLAGRDPDTGRIIFGCKGGGRKKYFRALKYDVPIPTEPGNFYVERIIDIIEDDFRTAHLAIACNGTNLRYRIATSEMKIGDLVKSTKYIPPVAVIPKVGDTYPLGALPVGTMICCLQKSPDRVTRVGTAAGLTFKIKETNRSKVLVQLKKKLLVYFNPKCLATVGQVSNVGHINEQYGSPNAKRRDGIRPRSGLYQKKTGKYGRKVKPIRIKNFAIQKKKKNAYIITLTHYDFQKDTDIVPCVNRVS